MTKDEAIKTLEENAGFTDDDIKSINAEIKKELLRLVECGLDREDDFDALVKKINERAEGFKHRKAVERVIKVIRAIDD